MPLTDTESRILLTLLKIRASVPTIRIKEDTQMFGDTVDKWLPRLQEKELVNVQEERGTFRHAKLVGLTELGYKVANKLREIEDSLPKPVQSKRVHS